LSSQKTTVAAINQILVSAVQSRKGGSRVSVAYNPGTAVTRSRWPSWQEFFSYDYVFQRKVHTLVMLGTGRAPSLCQLLSVTSSPAAIKNDVKNVKMDVNNSFSKFA